MRQELLYRAGVAGILAQRAARPSFVSLWDSEVSVFSQWGEDGILDLLCDHAGLVKPRAVEFGAGNFTECNTRFLAEYRSASVMAVDGRDDLIESVDGLAVKWRTTILARQEWITPTTAPEILRDARAAFGGVDVVSLDIDGNDYWVAAALPLSDEAIAVVEYNPLFGSGHAVSVPRDDMFDRIRAHHSWLYYGASLRAFVTLLAGKGYAFVGTNRAGSNAFFLRRDLTAGFPLTLPDPGDLSRYVDWRAREARDATGMLSYLHGDERIALMAELPLVDTITGAELRVGDAHGASAT
jgi:hypothetical protein